MHLKIFYPGGVSYGVVSDDSSMKEIYEVMYKAATIEEGNGNVKKNRTGKAVDDGCSK